ncbi:MAG TPA: alpha/beta hydrolase [Usitatibacter sp.]|nr:alpha/beta hydrolase [Usitatibacter sp.]
MYRFAVVLLALAGCSLQPPYVPEPQPLEPGGLPTPNAALNLPHLGPCTDSADRTLNLSTRHAVTVLVHGCNGSAGRFRSLAQLYAFHGQQAICFSYDDRDSLLVSSSQLNSALDELARNMPGQEVTVIGHSMGGLVARKAMERGSDERRVDEPNVKLVTVSAPLAGIGVASACGYKALHWLSLGAVPASCWMVTGDNWYEVTSSSPFIRKPGPLRASVRQYLKVVTDERDTCRYKRSEGSCVASDYTFSLAEQYQPVIDAYPQVTNVEVKAGHVEIVGEKEVAPRKLLAILQRQGLMADTAPERRGALERLLAELY